MEIQSYFPKMPTDVFEQFVKPQIKFEIDSLIVLEALIKAPGWAPYFRNEPFQYWSRIDWIKVETPFKDAPIDEKAINFASKLVNDFEISGSCETARRASVHHSKDRFEACKSFMQSSWAFPKPVICLRMSSGQWDLLDGYHRVSALLSLENNADFPFECWVGTYSP